MGRITVVTGDYNGRSDCAMGMAMKAAAAGRQVIHIVFDRTVDLEGMSLIHKLEPEIKVFSFADDAQTEEIKVQQLRNGLNFARKVMDINECDFLVLDGALELMSGGVVTKEELCEVLSHQGMMDIVITGGKLEGELEGCTEKLHVSRVSD